MGQYYRPTIIDGSGSVQVLSSYDFDNGAKLMEHSWIGNRFVGAALSLIKDKRACVAWIGDYSCEPYQPNEDAYAKIMPYERFCKYYEAAWRQPDAFKVPPNKFTEADLSVLGNETTGMYLVNHDSREYISLEAYIRDNGAANNGETWCVNPLPLLTACGNDRGGGDFHDGNTGYENVGVWAFAVIEYTSKAPGDYTEKSYKFIEDYSR